MLGEKTPLLLDQLSVLADILGWGIGNCIWKAKATLAYPFRTLQKQA